MLPVPVPAAWDVISKWERIGEVVPALAFRVARESLNAAGMPQALVAAELSLAMITVRYTCRVTFEPREWRQSWSLVPAAELEELRKELPALPRNGWLLREATGSMQLQAWDDSALLVYRNRIVPKLGVPHAVETLLTKQLVREFLGGLRQYFFEQIARGAYDVALQSAGPLSGPARSP